jgi:hypothetical protein
MQIARKDSTIEPLAPGELEVHIFSDKTIACGKTSHAALRYHTVNPNGREYYVSIYPQEANTNPLACLPVKFRKKTDDEDHYMGLALRGPIIPRDRYTTSVYRFSGNDIHVDRLHTELIRLQKIRLQRGNDRPEPQESECLEEIPGDGYVIPNTNALLTPDDQFFKMYSCTSFELCCTSPPFSSLPGCLPRHNCTSLVVHLLGSAGVGTDLSTHWVWIRFGFQLLWMASIGYSAKEVIRTDSSNIKADDVLAMIALGVGGAAWVLTHVIRPLLNFLKPNAGTALIASHMRLSLLGHPYVTSAEGLLLQNASASILYGLVTTVYAMLSLTVHACTIPDPFGKGEGYDFLKGTAAGAGIAAGLFLLVQIYGFFQDWQNGCSNPRGLKQVLDRAALFNVAQPLNAPAPLVPVPDNQQPLIENDQL